jgi:hypothetical protein
VVLDETGQQALAEELHHRISTPCLDRVKRASVPAIKSFRMAPTSATLGCLLSGCSSCCGTAELTAAVRLTTVVHMYSYSA